MTPPPSFVAQPARRMALGFGAAMVLTAAAAQWRAPAQAPKGKTLPVGLDGLFPARLGEWSLDRFADVFIRPDDRRRVYGVYDEVLERIYLGPGGAQVMLCVAYGGRQSDGLQLHRPENCYRAAGFEVSGLQRLNLRLAGHSVSAAQLLAARPGRSEPITYWTVIGDRVETDPDRVKWLKMLAGLRGEVLDGMLVRISTLDRDVARAHRVHAAFAEAMAQALDPRHRTHVIGV